MSAAAKNAGSDVKSTAPASSVPLSVKLGGGDDLEAYVLAAGKGDLETVKKYIPPGKTGTLSGP
jgi:hypothetical protein